MGEHEAVAPGASDETTRLVVRRLRAGLWILLLAIALFTITGLRYMPARFPALAPIKLIQLATILGAFWVVRAPHRWRWAVATAVFVACEVCITSAASAIVEHDVATTCLLFIVFTTAGATFLPWGIGAQAIMVAVAAGAFAVNAALVGVPLAAVASPAVAMVLAFVTSLYIAWDAPRHHRARRRAEEALAAGRRQSDAEARVGAALARVAREMMSVLDGPGLLERLCRVTTEVLGSERSHIWLWDRDTEALIAVAGHGDLPGHGDVIEGLAVPRARVAHLLRRLEGEDLVQTGARWARAASQPPASLHAALRRGDEIIGIHTAGFAEGTPVTAEHERIMRGIGQLAGLAMANAQLVEKLEEASRTKSQFVSTVSHELRTPINVILGYADMVQDLTDGADPRSDLVRRIHVAGRDLLDLVETTLEVGRIEAHRDTVRPERIDLQALLAKLGDDCARLPRHAGVELCWAPAPAVRVLTDPRKLTLVVRNLVTNALKFTEQGRVTVDCRVAGDGIELRVTDTGIGIPAADQERIFEMFRQADGSDARRYGGLGLGLYLVRSFVEQLGGTVALASTPGVGSVFTVRLPGIRAAAAAA